MKQAKTNKLEDPVFWFSCIALLMFLGLSGALGRQNLIHTKGLIAIGALDAIDHPELKTNNGVTQAH